jgi:hypothetical protein
MLPIEITLDRITIPAGRAPLIRTPLSGSSNRSSPWDCSIPSPCARVALGMMVTVVMLAQIVLDVRVLV